MKSKLNRLYVYQVKNSPIENTLSVVESKLENTSREVDKEIHQYYGFSIAYKFPIFGGSVYMFPVVDSFVDLLAPARYTTNDLPDSKRDALTKASDKSAMDSTILIELPDGLSESESTYLIKLMGLCFPGYYAPVESFPEDGSLNIREHMYIETKTTDGFDVLDEIENIVRGHVRK